MKLYYGKEYLFWKCNVKSCKKKLGLVAMRFEHNKLSFVTILWFMCCFCEEMTSKVV